ncbi:hypothetical protein KC19_3G139200 [Ceratodon purpureus]|uniref:Uncharacterized protein n=1 Tax=Ceratodon purpureus TaxID=3225 RepID=A0A8T0IKC8_CERPU|nr:hypothetical protein KC19_3G139200 [Ceratodon purpureus]
MIRSGTMRFQFLFLLRFLQVELNSHFFRICSCSLITNSSLHVWTTARCGLNTGSQ